MHSLCRILVALFLLAWIAALALLAIGTFGLFGQPRSPLAGVFVLPLGLPWNLWLQPLPEALRPWLAILAPGLNLAILSLLCRRTARRSPRRG